MILIFCVGFCKSISLIKLDHFSKIIKGSEISREFTFKFKHHNSVGRNVTDVSFKLFVNLTFLESVEII